MGLNVYQQATLAMMGQSHKLNTISQNIANINTDGFKRTDTEFQTLLSSPFVSPSADTNTSNALTSGQDFGGVVPVDLQRITQQGQIRTTDRNLDVAISGDGFFMVSPDINVNSNIMYTRRGSFDLNITDLTDTVTLDDGTTTATVNQGFLADQFGNFVLGVPVNADGSFTLGNPAPMRIDQFAFATTGIATSSAEIDINLPANADDGQTELASMSIVDSNFNNKDLSLSFSKVIGTNNQWDFRLIGDSVASVTSGNAAAWAGLTTNANQLVRFTKNIGGNDLIEVRQNQVPDNPLTPSLEPAQVGPGIAGAFAGLRPGDQITLAGVGLDPGNNGTFTIATVSQDQSSITLSSATPIAVSGVEANEVDAGNTPLTPTVFSSTAQVLTTLQFANTGGLSSTDSYSFDVTFTDSASASFTLDVSGFTQFAGAFDVSNFRDNGAERANIEALSVGPGGEIEADFTDGTRRALYKITLATFPNPNGLEMRTGHLFDQSITSGPPTTVFADSSGFATIIGSALEGSNVDLGVEMTRLIAAQSAYNVAATTFKTADEMLQEAANLKR